MKKTVNNIGKAIAIYMVAIVILNMIVALILIQYYDIYSYFEMTTYLLCGAQQIVASNNTLVSIILALKKLIEGVALAILCSFIFSYILNREIKVIFPDKIVIRRRTSEGSEGVLTLAVLIGNPNKTWLHDVKCNVSCTYLKDMDTIVQKNSEISLNSEVEFIQNYYRFSFEISEFHKAFWRHYLEKKPEYINNDFLFVTVTGKVNGLGGYFKVSKKYTLQDIVIDVHNPEKRFKKKVKNIFTGNEKIKIDWKEFPKYIEVGEVERQDIVNDIRSYLN